MPFERAEMPGHDIVFQPIIDLTDDERRVAGYEALSRFEGTSPDKVFAAAKENGTGPELELAAIELAIHKFHPPTDEAYLALNASAKTLTETRGELVRDPGLEVPWPRIVIEISEKDQVNDYIALDEVLTLLTRRKVQIAIDDVGSGYSGLWHLIQIKRDIMKIDGGYIRNLDENPSKRVVVEGLIGIAKGLGIKTVAECIETEAELDWLQSKGIDFGQGYFLGRPQSLEPPQDSQQSTPSEKL